VAAVLPVTPLTPVRRLAAVLLAGLAVVAMSSCTSSTHSAAPSAPTASGPDLITHTDAAFSLSFPNTWTYKEGSEQRGVYNNFIGPKGASGYEPAVLVARTTHADGQAFADVITLFDSIHPDRTLQPAESLAVAGAQRASIVRNTRTDKGTPLQSWNVFVLTPSKVVLNLEFVAPAAEFDSALMTRILGTLLAR
jgi:hypothetical protein